MAQRRYSQSVVKTLFAHSRNVCAFYDSEGRSPACEEQLTDPGWRQVKAAICHIAAVSPGGPRWVEGMSEDELNGYDNLLLLCPNHHLLIDKLEPDRFPADVLREMKRRHEARSPMSTWEPSESELEAMAAAAIGVTESLAAVPMHRPSAATPADENDPGVEPSPTPVAHAQPRRPPKAGDSRHFEEDGMGGVIARTDLGQADW